jgi:hypothetical protein
LPSLFALGWPVGPTLRDTFGGRQMTRFVLVALSLLLATSQFLLAAPITTTVTGHFLSSLTYAFTPALAGAIIAGLKVLVQKLAKRPTNFAASWHWAWGVFLAILWAVEIIAIIKAWPSLTA